ncbi:uncharacterized protein [Choristoneura fumiferana]|uniref:uncharacterized protein n=1 Tax=Choristoneura fumiferana TaxID=7141 RepID=UPI003D15E693
MSPLARSLLALTVVTLLHGACADSQDQSDRHCTTVSRGKKEGVKKVLDTFYIPAGQRTATIDLPTVCIDNINLDEIVRVCDDVPATVRVRNWPNDRHWPLHTSVLIIRNGDYEHHVATVDVTLMCPN